MLAGMDDWMDWLRGHFGGVLLAGAFAVGGLWWWEGRPLAQPPGILVAEDPVQEAPESKETWDFRGFRITPLARFNLRARILGVERYRFDPASKLSPVDLALGWGPMSDSKVLDAISIRQSGRWYFWSATELPLSSGEISRHSANMHMIPSNPGLARRLTGARVGQVVHLEGLLVRADGPDGWHWVSSLSRNDTGDGSCEVVWVEQAEVTDR